MRICPEKLLRRLEMQFKIDSQNNTVYVENLYRMGQAIGQEWSGLAEEVHWKGWRWVNGIPGEGKPGR